MKRKIAILGAGMMGSALAFPAAENGHDVRIIGTCLDDDIIDGYIRTRKHEKFCRPFPENVSFHYFKDWKKAVEGCDFIIGGVSSFGVDWFLEEILTQLNPKMPVLSVTKGLRATEDGSLLSYPGYWESELAKRGIKRDICAIGGPCTSYELVFMDPSEVGFCGKDSKALKMMKEAMQRPYYHISLTNDVIGLESAVALKNAYAMAVTLAVGLNTRWHGENKPAGALYLFTSGDYRGLRYLQQAHPDAEMLVITGNPCNDETIALCKALGISRLGATMDGTSRKSVRKAHKEGLTVSLWPGNSLDDAVLGAYLGADYLCTDVPLAVKCRRQVEK